MATMSLTHGHISASGNLLLLEDGRVGFIDFGIVGRISDKVFASVRELSVAIAANDSEGMAIALCNMGAADDKVDTKQFGRDIERVLARMNNVQSDVTVMATQDGRIAGRIQVDESDITNLLLELVDVTENNGLKLPREFGLLVKQMLYFDRYIKILAPDMDVMSDSRLMFGESRAGSNARPMEGSETVIDV
jgi:aarF domain-containing kinase